MNIWKHYRTEKRQDICRVCSAITLYKDVTDTVDCLNICQNCLYERSTRESGLAQTSYQKHDPMFCFFFSPLWYYFSSLMTVGQIHLAVDGKRWYFSTHTSADRNAVKRLLLRSEWVTQNLHVGRGITRELGREKNFNFYYRIYNM